mmetsp:Transcript_31027/g.92265  ORF Transcript_31027/g.92265 Transcript_31027/m.92265 type:complete len:233 (+) Transcript_31027:1203-1901(+)
MSTCRFLSVCVSCKKPSRPSCPLRHARSASPRRCLTATSMPTASWRACRTRSCRARQCALRRSSSSTTSRPRACAARSTSCCQSQRTRACYRQRRRSHNAALPRSHSWGVRTLCVQRQRSWASTSAASRSWIQTKARRGSTRTWTRWWRRARRRASRATSPSTPSRATPTCLVCSWCTAGTPTGWCRARSTPRRPPCARQCRFSATRARASRPSSSCACRTACWCTATAPST